MSRFICWNVEARDLMDGVADVMLWRMVSRKRCLETMNRLWNLEAIETSDCHWKLEGEIGSFLLKDRLKSLANLGFLRCWRSGLVGLQAPVVKTHGSVMPKLSITIRQIRTMKRQMLENREIIEEG